MPYIVPNNISSYSNIPLPPTTRKDSHFFPNDLTTNGRNSRLDINFVSYQSTTSVFGTILNGITTLTGRTVVPVGGLSLPLPKKINDVQTVVWSEESMTGVAGSMMKTVAGSMGVIASLTEALVGDAASAIGASMGATINPFLYMAFKNPAYKEHTLQWTLAPNNAQESATLANLIKFLKYNMLPAKALLGSVYTYPCIAIISMTPNVLQFKPCAVMSVQVDYTGAGGPSFFRDGRPTVVNLVVQLKEIELWTKDDYNGGDIINNILPNIEQNTINPATGNFQSPYGETFLPTFQPGA
jgi:hypothetical protein